MSPIKISKPFFPKAMFGLWSKELGEGKECKHAFNCKGKFPAFSFLSTDQSTSCYKHILEKRNNGS